MPQNRLSILPDIVTGISIVISIIALTYYNYLSDYMLIQVLLVNGILDVLDGKLARMFKTKNMQKQGQLIDSIADAINFGLFPAIVIALKSQSLLLSLLYFSSIIFRLIRFTRSYTPAKTLTYKGAPSPFGAIMALSGILISQKFLFYSVITSIILIISNVPTLVIHRLVPKNPVIFYLVTTVLVVIAFLYKYALFIYILLYLLHIPFASLLSKYIFPKISNE